MSKTLAIAAILFAGTTYADTLDLAFLVEQEVVSYQCPGHEVGKPERFTEAIKAEGRKLGWTDTQLAKEAGARREHQLELLKADPTGYCAKADELKDASAHRLSSFLPE